MPTQRPFAAYVGDEPYVFVCYGHDDDAVVYPEIAWLREQGTHIWYDEGIEPGHEFPEAIARAIEGAAKVVFYVSGNSVASRHCRNEVYFALEHGKTLVVVHLEPTKLPAGLALTTATTQALLRHELPAEEYRRKLVAALTGRAPGVAMPKVRRRRLGASFALACVVVAAIALTAFAPSFYESWQGVQWARNEALPEISRLVDESWRDYTAAYALAEQAEQHIRGDPTLDALFAKAAVWISVDSEPRGAEVFIKPYAEPNAPWRSLGTTPISEKRVPIGIMRWKFEKQGYATVEAAEPTWSIGLPSKLLVANRVTRTLDALEDTPDGMVRVPGDGAPEGELDDFFIDRYEVTNADFAQFVAAGGYQNESLWRQPVFEGDAVVPWREAVERFIDETGRPGPATWMVGDYRPGTANEPVRGVSWYEALAYAEWRGNTLPTSRHWDLARGERSSILMEPPLGGFGTFAPFSNFRGAGPVPVGSLNGPMAYGAYDMAGNVREWCWNETPLGRLIRGGAWDDNIYKFNEPSQAPALDRSPQNGFRTMRLMGPLASSHPVLAPVAYVVPPEHAFEPVSDEVFEFYRNQFSYDSTPLNEIVQQIDESAASFRYEVVDIDAAYGGQRMRIHLFLPKNAQRPLQTVVYFPGSATLSTPSSGDLAGYYEYPTFLSFLVKSGRAVAFPIYDGTFERIDRVRPPRFVGEQTVAYTEFVVRLIKDLRRSVDYLTTRDDIDADRIAYYGMSWGALMGAVAVAIEPRFKSAILLAGGIGAPKRPEVDERHYAERVTTPVLMLNGRFDTLHPVERAILPLFERFGVDDEQKRLLLYDTDHIPPREEFVRESLAWLDRWLGPLSTSNTR